MTTYKLTYFNFTGLGEPIRYLLSYGGIKFEDHRVSSEEWPKIKSKMPMGQMPILEIDGKQYNQSKAIVRFLAKKFDLHGSDDYEALEIDAAADNVGDLGDVVSKYYWEEDPEQKKRMKEIEMEKRPLLLEKLEAQVKKNGGYFVNGKLSWADIWFAARCDYLSNILGFDVTKGYPELEKLVGKIRAIPNIKAYLEKRPKTHI
uniref:glutathione transferase n=1 Tax=Meteorus pulchricornis TaxID=51522 RepID=A0A6M3GXG4_9HYME|nr:glutathione S transferase Sigma 1 [Meteorus pulchricornis]